MATQSIQSWIEEVANDPAKSKPCTGFALSHVVGTTRKEVDSVLFGSKSWTTEELAKRFKYKADNHASELPGVQYFELAAFYGTTEAQAFKTFRINGALEYDGISSEGPTGQGMFQQGMRHLEAMTQATFRKDAHMFETMKEVVDIVTKRYHEASVELRDATQIVNQLVREKIESEVKQDKERLEYERSTQERKMWLGLLPPLANTITGREIFPQSFADSKMVEAIIDSLDEEQIAQLGGILKPEQMAIFANRATNRLRQLREKREQETAITKTEGSNGNGKG